MSLSALTNALMSSGSRIGSTSLGASFGTGPCDESVPRDDSTPRLKSDSSILGCWERKRVWNLREKKIVNKEVNWDPVTWAVHVLWSIFNFFNAYPLSDAYILQIQRSQSSSQQKTRKNVRVLVRDLAIGTYLSIWSRVSEAMQSEPCWTWRRNLPCIQITDAHFSIPLTLLRLCNILAGAILVISSLQYGSSYRMLLTRTGNSVELSRNEPSSEPSRTLNSYLKVL